MPGLVGNIALNAASNAINKIERRISGTRVARAGKEFTPLISNEDMDEDQDYYFNYGTRFDSAYSVGNYLE